MTKKFDIEQVERQHKIGYFRLFAACVYELLLLVALWFMLAWLFIAIFGDATLASKRLFLQIYLWLITGAYFIWCWCKSGQTLAMQTWKMRLVNQHGLKLTFAQAITRYVLASLSAMIVGLGFLWALLDKEQLYLHDRLLKTRFIRV